MNTCMVPVPDEYILVLVHVRYQYGMEYRYHTWYEYNYIIIYTGIYP